MVDVEDYPVEPEERELGVKRQGTYNDDGGE